MFRFYVALILAAEAVFLVVLPFIAPGAPVFLFAAVIPLTLIAAFVVRRVINNPAFRMRRISPEEITGYTPGDSLPEQEPNTPEGLSALIVERTAEIRRTLEESPSEVQVEMCALGYRACVNDMITLTHRINEELPNAGFIRRFFLNRIRKKATDALSETREALPPGALRATRQEQQ